MQRLPACPQRQLQQDLIPEAHRHMQLFLLIVALGPRQLQQNVLPEAHRHMTLFLLIVALGPRQLLQQDPLPEAHRHMKLFLLIVVLGPLWAHIATKAFATLQPHTCPSSPWIQLAGFPCFRSAAQPATVIDALHNRVQR